MIEHLLAGFAQALTPMVLIYTFVGVCVGTAIGVLPGLGPAATVGLLLPVTFGMNPLAAMSMLCGVYYGAQYGGSTTSILLNVPGESASVITCLDGHAMAKKGRAGPALGISAIGSFIAGIVGTILLLLIGEPLARAALNFGPAEYTVVMLLGLSMATSLGGNQLKAVIMCILGLLCSTIGTDTFTGGDRFTFGIDQLDQGIELVPILMGLFALSDILIEIENGIVPMPDLLKVSTRMRDLLPNREDMKRSWGPILRGSFGGFFLCTLPGIGAAAASYFSYAAELRISKEREKFGTGMIEGVAGPESANNSATSGAMVPLLTLGIPGTATAAVLAGGLMMYGLTPGPLLFRDNPTFVYGLIATMFVGNLMLIILNLPLISIWIKMVKVPLHILYPVVIAFVLLGAYTMNFALIDVAFLAVFGFLGYFAKKTKMPGAPFILGLFLGPTFEASLRRALISSRGSLGIFVNRPISLAMMVLTVLILAGPTVIKMIKKKDIQQDEEDSWI